MGVTNGLLLPIPELTEGADGPAAFGALANGVEDYVLDRILPTGVTHYAPHHWGSGTAFPLSTSGVKTGDLYLHTGLGCTMRCITPGSTQANGVWKQAETTVAASATARTAISTNYAAQLHDGFRVFQQDTKVHWFWIVSTGTWALQMTESAWSWRPDNAPNETALQIPPKIYFGQLSVTFPTQSFFVSSVGFPNAGFTEPPTLLLTIGGENAASVWVGYDSLTTTGATIVGRASGNIALTTTCSFMAIGK